MTATKKAPRTLDARIRRVLRWLDSSTSREMVAEYKTCAREQEGSVRKALEADEKSMASEGFESR